jgi:hypothetical protein
VSITLLPTPPSRLDPTNFAIRADAFLGALPVFATEANALATTVNSNATAAAASAASAASSFDSFDDRYLGPKSTNPTVDNDGNALLSGALYWNTTTPEMRVWNGTAWVAVQSTSAATNAAASATASATSATNSANSATASATSATNSANSATASAASATAAAASLDSFDDRYLGPKSSNPSLDNDNNSLITGALYWNTTSSEMFVWTGTAWLAVQTTSAATAAATAATNAANSSVSAANSATAAAGSAAVAAARLDDFEGSYLGSKVSAPSLDNDGNVDRKSVV